MTDDIVARLRDCTCVPHGDIVREAADEIERLRKEREEAEPLLNELWERRTEATEMRSEIERLRAAIANWSRADQEWVNIDVPTAQAMETLRGAERKLRDAAGIRLPIQSDRQFDGVTE